MNEKVKQAIEKIRELDLYDLHSEDFDNILGALINLEELIKGKDEYIAKLCCDRAELKDHEKELIAEQHRLFDLAKEQENELKELREFTKLAIGKNVCLLDINIDENANDYNEVNKYHLTICQISQVEFDLLKKVVEKYGKR